MDASVGSMLALSKTSSNLLSVAPALVILVIVVFGTGSAQALHRDSGEFWVYQVEAVAQLGPAPVAVSGAITVTCKGVEGLNVGRSQEDVIVLDIKGYMDGESEWMGEPVTAHVTAAGSLYERIEDAGTVMTDIRVFMSGTIGPDSFPTALSTESRVFFICLPGWLSGFVPGITRPGESWVERVLVEDAFGAREENLTVWVSSTFETVGTPAGEFDSLKITLGSEASLEEVRWWSDDVGAFVRLEVRESPSKSPSLVMVLDSYGKSDEPKGRLFLAVGVVGAIAASSVLATVILRDRKVP
ncbi:MAG: hypothetical protein QXZ19_02070 [Thermoplasmata archaeon]